MGEGVFSCGRGPWRGWVIHAVGEGGSSMLWERVGPPCCERGSALLWERECSPVEVHGVGEGG